jgi:hypothetical protein
LRHGRAERICVALLIRIRKFEVVLWRSVIETDTDRNVLNTVLLTFGGFQLNCSIKIARHAPMTLLDSAL